MIREIVKLLSLIEASHGVKCIHNEINILTLLFERGQVPSLEIFSLSRRSLAGHNSDLRRLVSIGLINYTNGKTDKRERLYELTDKGREMLLEHEELLQRVQRTHDRVRV